MFLVTCAILFFHCLIEFHILDLFVWGFFHCLFILFSPMLHTGREMTHPLKVAVTHHAKQKVPT